VICRFHHQDRVLSRPESGNGAIVAQQLRALTAAKDVTVSVHHIQQTTRSSYRWAFSWSEKMLKTIEQRAARTIGSPR
jgi:hypothetical protein